MNFNLIGSSAFLFDTIPNTIYIDSSGNLGIGTNNPINKLDINGSMNLTGTLKLNSFPGDSGSVLISGGNNFPPFWQNQYNEIWKEDSIKIFHFDKDVYIKKTLVNLGDYSDNQDQTIFQKWFPNCGNNCVGVSFNFTGGIFANPIPSIQPNNYVYNFGSNLNPGGGKLIDSLPAYGLAFEDRFYIDNKAFNEFHILAVDSFGSRQRRPLTCAFAFDGSSINMSHQLSQWNLHDKNDTKQIYSIDTENETWNYNGSNLRHIFNSTNYSPLWQKNINNEVIPMLGLYDNKFIVGNPNGNSNLQIGKNLLLGVDLDNMDFIGCGLGDGAKNFKIGIDSFRYNSIIINTMQDIIFDLRNNSNQVGWKLGSNINGDLFFIDGNSNHASFILAKNMPSNSFSMFSNGNLCLNGTDQSQRLTVNGNIKLNGSFIVNGSTGISNQILKSSGDGNSPIWTDINILRKEEIFTASQNQEEFILSTSFSPALLNNIPIEVFVNGIKQRYTSGPLSHRRFYYEDNILFLYGIQENDEIEVVYNVILFE